MASKTAKKTKAKIPAKTTAKSKAAAKPKVKAKTATKKAKTATKKAKTATKTAAKKKTNAAAKPAAKPAAKKASKAAPKKAAKPASKKPTPKKPTKASKAAKPAGKSASKSSAKSSAKSSKKTEAKTKGKADSKSAAKTATKKQAKSGQEEIGDSPLLDSLGANVKKMITSAKERGYVTYDELNKNLPPDHVSSEQIEDTMSMLSEMGINVVESEEDNEEDSKPLGTTEEEKPKVSGNVDESDVGRTDDPVRMYLREMGSVELLSREGEIAIAKRIEAGREMMIGGICESPLTMKAIAEWH